MLDTATDQTFAEFYEQAFERVARAVRVPLGPDAEDVAQEALLVAHARWAEVRMLERPEAWVRRVALRMASRRGQRDRERVRREASVVPSLADPVPDLDLVAAVLGLPDRHAAAIRIHHLEDRPLAEVADALACSEGAAKVLLHRSRRVLAERLAGIGGRWVSERTWTIDGMVRHLRETGPEAYVAPVLADVEGRGGRFELTIADGAYVLRRDDGKRFDHGASRVAGNAFEAAPTLGVGRARYRATVEGRRLSLRLLDSTTPPSHGVPDAVWIGLFLESAPFVRADASPGV